MVMSSLARLTNQIPEYMYQRYPSFRILSTVVNMYAEWKDVDLSQITALIRDLIFI